MTVGVIVDTVSDNSVLDELGKYRTVVLVNTPMRATKVFSKVKKTITNKPPSTVVSIKISDIVSDETDVDELLELLFANIGKTFAGYKEPTVVWHNDKCVVY